MSGDFDKICEDSLIVHLHKVAYTHTYARSITWLIVGIFNGGALLEFRRYTDERENDREKPNEKRNEKNENDLL